MAPYQWSQTTDEVSVCFGVPSDLNTKCIDVLIKPSNISVMFAGVTVSALALFSHIKVDDSTWVREGSELCISLAKRHPQPWLALVGSEVPLANVAGCSPCGCEC